MDLIKEEIATMFDNKKPKHDITISNTIMNSIIDKKLGTITYHYNNTKSKI